MSTGCELDGPSDTAAAPPAPGPPPPDERPGGSALVAIGAVLVLALVGAGGVLVWARVATDASPVAGPVGLEDEVPTTFADGSPAASAPPAVAGAVDAPAVVVAAPRDAGAVDGCVTDDLGLDDARVVQAAVSPDGLLVTAVGTSEDVSVGDGDEDADVRSVPSVLTCEGQPQGDGWSFMSSSMGTRGEGAMVGWGGGDGAVQTAFATLEPPEGTAWVVQDRGAYRLAWPVEEGMPVTVTWRFRVGLLGDGMPPPSPVVHLDADGEVLGEEVLRA